MKMLFFGVLIFVGQEVQVCSAQDQGKIDSLMHRLSFKDEEEQFDLMFGLSIEYVDYDNERAFLYIEKAIVLSGSDTLKFVKSNRLKAQLLNRMSRPTDALVVLSQIVKVAEKNNYQNEYEKILNGIALAHTYIGQYDKALEALYLCLEKKEQNGRFVQVGVSLYNIGTLFYKVSNYGMALYYYNRALERKLYHKDHYDLAELYFNIGLCYKELSDFENGMIFMEKALATCKNDCDYVTMLVEYGRGYNHLGEGNLVAAKKHFTKSLVLAEVQENLRFIAENLVCLANIHIQQNDFQVAEKQILRSEAISLKQDFREILISSYRQQIALYREIGDRNKLSISQSNYIKVRDDIYNEKVMHNLTKLQVNFEEREHLKLIALQEQSLKQQRYLNIAIGCTVMLLLVILMLLSKRYQAKKKVNALLEARVKERTEELIVRYECDRNYYNELLSVTSAGASNIHASVIRLKGIRQMMGIDLSDRSLVEYLHWLDEVIHELNSVVSVIKPKIRS